MWLLNILTVLALVLMVSILWTYLLGAPWLPTTKSRVHKMLQMARVGPDDLVYDLGCGDGRTIIAAARRCGARAVGIEIDPLRYLWCQLLIAVLGLRGRVRIIFGDIFRQDLSEATVVTCYLLPNSIKKLEVKLLEELRPGTRLVSNNFPFPRLHTLQQDDENHLYLYLPVP